MIEKDDKEKQKSVDFGAVKMEIMIRANNEGPIEEIESWRKAFPDVEFMEIDEVFSCEEIDWSSRTIDERAFFVAYMRDPQAAKVKYEIEVEGEKMTKVIKDSENIWWMWIEGCFSKEELDESALRTFLWYADESPLARRYTQDIDLDKVSVLSLSAKVGVI